MIYLSIGSNVGDRFKYIQLAVGIIAYRIGAVKQVSSIVETPAWGFESDPFYNACIEINTTLTAEEVLDQLIQIEEFLGRKRARVTHYQARTIDLDILMYKDQKINTSRLVIPHPRMNERSFVLSPLAEIAAEEVHPVANETIIKLFHNCPDKTPTNPVDQTLYIPNRYDYIAIEGNIGAGKTAFAQQLNTVLGGTILLENFYNNPYLADFYKDPLTFALAVEKAFLNDRIKQLRSFFKQKNPLPVIADFTLEKSILFAEQNLTKEAFFFYQRSFEEKRKKIPSPQRIILLAQEIDQLQYNIKKRGRGFEQNITKSYLKKIEKGYAGWHNKKNLPIKTLSLKGVDFIKYPSELHKLLLAFFQV